MKQAAMLERLCDKELTVGNPLATTSKQLSHTKNQVSRKASPSPVKPPREIPALTISDGSYVNDLGVQDSAKLNLGSLLLYIVLGH